MFSDISNVNIVISLLVAHNVRHVVVCPGSRNAPLVHDFHVHEKIKCYPITDERSAGFFALGMAPALEYSSRGNSGLFNISLSYDLPL